MTTIPPQNTQTACSNTYFQHISYISTTIKDPHSTDCQVLCCACSERARSNGIRSSKHRSNTRQRVTQHRPSDRERCRSPPHPQSLHTRSRQLATYHSSTLMPPDPHKQAQQPSRRLQHISMPQRGCDPSGSLPASHPAPCPKHEWSHTLIKCPCTSNSPLCSRCGVA